MRTRAAATREQIVYRFCVRMLFAVVVRACYSLRSIPNWCNLSTRSCARRSSCGLVDSRLPQAKPQRTRRACRARVCTNNQRMFALRTEHQRRRQISLARAKRPGGLMCAHQAHRVSVCALVCLVWGPGRRVAAGTACRGARRSIS